MTQPAKRGMSLPVLEPGGSADGQPAPRMCTGLRDAATGQIVVPATCLAECLHGDPDRLDEAGCAWLRAELLGQETTPTHPGQTCEQGHRIYSPGQRAGSPVRVVAVEAARPSGRRDGESVRLRAAQALHHVDQMGSLLDSLTERLQQREQENAQLVEEVLQNYEQLNLLFEINRASAGARSEVDLYAVTLERLLAPVHADIGAVVMPDLHPVACVLNPEYPCGPRNLCAGSLLQRLRPALEEALHDWDTPVRSVEVEGVERCSDTRWNCVIIPMQAGGEHMGLAVFAKPASRGPFRTTHTQLASAVIGHAAQTAQTIRLFADLQQMSTDVVRAMVNAIDAKDHYTYGHSERVAEWSVLIARHLGMSEEQLQLMEWGGLLHDVGKIGIRDDVLGKPGRLTPEEYEHIKLHPVISCEVIRPIKRLESILGGLKHHHECWDGSGYPDGLKGEQIPFEARIIQIADVFDALTSSRSYRPARSVSCALRIMREELGGKLDPRLFEVFLEVLEQARRTHPHLFTHIPPDEEDPHDSA